MLERDEETGQDHAWWRKYESSSGRWTSPDPYTGSMSIGDPQSLNRYAYVQNDPVNFVDPSGLEETLACYVDGIPVSCSFGLSLINSGAGYLNGTPGFYGGGNILLTYAGNLHVDGLSMGFQQAFFNDPQDLPGGGEQEPNIKKDKKRKQQQEFNNCAKGKIRDFRRAEYGSIAKIAIGTFFTALSAGVGTAAGAANAAAQTGARSAGARIVGYTARYKFGELLAKGAPVVGAFTGTLAINGGIESWNNHEQLTKALASCKSQFPQADHSTLGIFLTTY